MNTPPYPQWAEWAAYQWAVERRQQRQIGEKLNGYSGSAVCSAIAKFLMAVCPQHADWARGSLLSLGLSVYAEDRRQVAKAYFQRRLPPSQPTGLTPPQISTALRRARAEQAWKKNPGPGRVFDPDEGTAPRGVWLP